MHQGDLQNKDDISENQWSTLFEKQEIINRIESEKVISEALEKSETDNQQKIRKEIKEKLHFDLIDRFI